MKNGSQHPDKTTAKDRDVTAIAGIKKYFAKVKQITLASTDYSPKAMIDALQAEVDAITALDAVKAQLMQQVADTQKVRANALALRTLLRKYILTTHGSAALQVLADFGMSVPKNMGPRTAEAKAQAQAKARVTRAAKKNALKNASSSPGDGSRPVAPVSTTPAAN